MQQFPVVKPTKRFRQERHRTADSLSWAITLEVDAVERWKWLRVEPGAAGVDGCVMQAVFWCCTRSTWWAAVRFCCCYACLLHLFTGLSAAGAVVLDYVIVVALDVIINSSAEQHRQCGVSVLLWFQYEATLSNCYQCMNTYLHICVLLVRHTYIPTFIST